MKTVKVYIETTITGPSKPKYGKYAAALAFTRKNGKTEDRFLQGSEQETTYNRSVLLAMVRAMHRDSQSHAISYSTQGIHLSAIWFRQTIRKSGDGQSGESRMEKTYRTRNCGSCSWKRAKNTR